jgi:hypothetical protein
MARSLEKRGHAMTDQLDLFTFVDTPGARTSDPSTSQEAATANPVGRSSGRRAILETLAVLGSATDCQLSHYTGLLRGSAAKRRGELVTAGLVERAGRGITDTGSPALTWRLTDTGHRQLTNLEEADQ